MTPKELTDYREELRRRIEADEEAAGHYAAKIAELRASADLGRAEMAGIDRAVEAFRTATAPPPERSVPRQAARLVHAAEDD